MNLVTDESLTPAFLPTPGGERSIGSLLVDAGKLTTEEAEAVLHYQREHRLRFGEAAIRLGMVTEHDIQLVLSRQFDYPCLAPGSGGFNKELVAAYQPFIKPVEALRALRTQLLLRWFTVDPEQKTLAIISPGRGEGRSHLAANLAVVFSQLGERTVLIDADMRNPRQHAIFNLSNQTGLSTVLSGRAGKEVVENIPEFVDLSVLPAGPTPPNPQELLGRPAFSRLLEELSVHYQVILIDTPPGIEYAEAQTIAVRAGGALLVTRKHYTRLQDAALLAKKMQGASAALVGSLLNEH